MRPDPASNPVSTRSLSSVLRTSVSRFLMVALLALAGIVAGSATASATTIHIRFGLRSQNCQGFGLCSIWTTSALEGPTADAKLSGTKRKMSVRLDDYIANGARPEVMPVDMPIELDAESARALGVKSLVVLPGNYRIDYSRHPQGEIVVDVVADYIHIGVNWGRRSLDCHGFGICSIVVDIPTFPDGTDRQVNSYASVDGEMLHVEFAERLPEQGDSVTIDEAIQVDKTTARLFESTRASVRKGVYPVDYSSNPNGSVDLPVERFGITIGIKPGRQSKGCAGFGICSITIDVDLSLNFIPATAEMVGPNTMRLTFQNGLPAGETTMPIDEAIHLDDSLAHQLKLGFGVVVIGGQNPEIRHNADGTPYVDVTVTRLGITIWVKIGRRDQRCTGFGLCDWGVDVSAERAVQSEAKLDGSRLTLAFGSKAPDAGDLLVIDEDIVLDPAEAHALGAEALTIRAGSYPVDYSANPYGTVQLNTLRTGITITIDAGRRSRNCEGFGICSITIDLKFSARSLPAVAHMVGRNTLRIRFIGELPAQDDLMPIDEAIRLSDEMARSLGAGEMTVLPGSYRVVRNADGSVHVDVDVVSQSITIWVKIGSAFNSCRGFGICAIGVERDLASARWASSNARLHGSTLTLSFAEPTADRGDMLTIDEDIVLDDATARSLGVRGLTIRAGRYMVDYSTNPNGTVNVNTLRIGITIDIEVGRRSRGCTGFGICSITVGLDFTERTVPSLGTIENGRLHLVFGRALPESGERMEIDEDIVLDAATARGLGRRSVVLKKGSYPVHTDPNGEQSVDIEIAARGIVITIEIGRRGCERGFGICRIDVDLRSTTRSAQAVAEMENGTLVLDLLGEAPDRESVMVLEEQVGLDTALLSALGLDSRQGRSISQGAYSLDTSENRYGTLRFQTRETGTSAVKGNSESRLATGTSAAPNPTSGTTTISFTLKHPAAVTMTIIDAQGRRIADPIRNTMMSAGEQQVSFDATSLPAGVYYYSIKAGGSQMSGSVTVSR